jgi:hypothetical protein
VSFPLLFFKATIREWATTRVAPKVVPLLFVISIMAWKWLGMTIYSFSPHYSKTSAHSQFHQTNIACFFIHINSPWIIVTFQTDAMPMADVRIVWHFIVNAVSFEALVYHTLQYQTLLAHA